MRLDLVQELLQLIAELDRQPFPEGAAVSWMPIMDGLDFEDARHTIMEWYGSSLARDRKGELRRILPADVRSGALRRAEDRARASRRGLPRAPEPPLAERSLAVQAEVAKAREIVAAASARHRAEVERAKAAA